MNFKEFLLTEAYQAIFYHGTPASNLAGILSKGMLPYKTGTWTTGGDINASSKAVYFTSSMSVAARYAVGAYKKETPIVLEFSMSTPKRFKKVEYDPMDRPENSWDEDGGGTTIESEFIYDMESDIRRFLKKLQLNIRVHLPLSDQIEERGVSAIDGFNLYRFILNTIQSKIDQQQFRQQKPQIVLAMQQAFPPGQYHGFAAITPSGTLRVTEQYFQNQAQFRYPKIIPPGAVKAIWVRQKDFTFTKGKTQKVEPVLLPDESKEKLEELKDLYNGLATWAEEAEEDIADEAADWIDRIWAEEIDDAEDLISALKKIIQLSNNGKDISKEMGALADMARDYETYVYDNWGQDITMPEETWVRIPNSYNNPIIQKIIAASKQ
jgi:hypothetical protein